MKEFIVGGFWLEKGEEGGGDIPWFWGIWLGRRRRGVWGLTWVNEPGLLKGEWA